VAIPDVDHPEEPMIRPPHPPSESPSAGTHHHTPRRRILVTAAAMLAMVTAGVVLSGAGTAGAADVTFPPPDATHGTSPIGGSTPMCPVIAPIPTSPPAVTGPDSVKPTIPGKPVVTSCGGYRYITWAPSQDNIGVRNYVLVMTAGDVVSSVTTYATGYRLWGGDSYMVFRVEAVDYAGNYSGASESTTVGTPPSCPTPVTCPTGVPPTTSGPATTSAPPVPTCSVAYTITSQWTGGFQGDVTIRNLGPASVNPWTLGFSFPSGQKLGQVWGATATQSGAVVTAHSVDWNKLIAPGGSASFGFTGTWTGSNARPTAFTLNGGGCQVA
jgi:hypothetical protein